MTTREAAGRPRAAAPRGRVTLREAAAQSGLSYAELYRRARAGQIAGAHQEAGVWTMRRSDVAQLTRRPPSTDERRAVEVRPQIARYAVWESAAQRRGLTVGKWLLVIADEASGWRQS